MRRRDGRLGSELRIRRPDTPTPATLSRKPCATATTAEELTPAPDTPVPAIRTAFCDAQKEAFNDTYTFKDHGGMTSMSDAMAGGMTLVMSVWDHHYADMLWLDSTYPTTKTAPGGPRGTCAPTSGVPALVEGSSPGASVTYSNIKFGPINSTYTAT